MLFVFFQIKKHQVLKKLNVIYFFLKNCLVIIALIIVATNWHHCHLCTLCPRFKVLGVLPKTSISE